jgi:hypothetical protein
LALSYKENAMPRKTTIMPSPSDKEAAQMKPGAWPEDRNPFLKPLNKESERKQEQGRRP